MFFGRQGERVGVDTRAAGAATRKVLQTSNALVNAQHPRLAAGARGKRVALVTFLTRGGERVTYDGALVGADKARDLAVVKVRPEAAAAQAGRGPRRRCTGGKQAVAERHGSLLRPTSRDPTPPTHPLHSCLRVRWRRRPSCCARSRRATRPPCASGSRCCRSATPLAHLTTRSPWVGGRMRRPRDQPSLQRWATRRLPGGRALPARQKAVHCASCCPARTARQP